jgi:triacylglycerol esterase/lipase EstA (alpha/beta hydrolase family)
VRITAFLLSLFVFAVVGFNLFTFAVAFAKPPRPRGIFTALARELLASLLLIPVWPLFMLIGASYARRREMATGTRPVVLIHGYAMNRTNWVWLGPTLAKRGLGPLHGMNYNSLATVAESAAQLGLFVERLCVEAGVSQVDIVAHSLGGIISRWYIERMGGAKRVGKLVTIATPHHGTRWARMAVGRVRHDLAHHSPLVTELGNGRPPDGVSYTSIWSNCDNLIVPADSSRIGPFGEDVIIDDHGHLALLTSQKVADAVAARLAA